MKPASWFSAEPVFTATLSPCSGLLIGVQEVLTGNSDLRTDRPERGTFDPSVVGHGQGSLGAVGIIAHHRDVLMLPNEAKAQVFQGFDYTPLEGVLGKLGHQPEISASATNASS